MGEYRKAIEAYYKVSYHGADGFSQGNLADFRRATNLWAKAIAFERIVQREEAARRRCGSRTNRVATPSPMNGTANAPPDWISAMDIDSAQRFSLQGTQRRRIEGAVRTMLHA